MTERPAPPAGMAEEHHAAWIEQRDRFFDRGDVVLRFGPEDVGVVTIATIGGGREEMRALGDVVVPAGAQSSLQIVGSNLDFLADLPPYTVEGIGVFNGGDDAAAVIGKTNPCGRLWLGEGDDEEYEKLGLPRPSQRKVLTDAGVGFLSEAKALRVLHVGGEITDAGLAPWAGLGELPMLHVDSDSVTGQGLQAVSSADVQFVFVCGDAVEVGRIPHLPSLKMLSLTGKAALQGADRLAPENFPTGVSLTLKLSDDQEPTFDELVPLYKALPGTMVNGTQYSARALEKILAKRIPSA